MRISMVPIGTLVISFTLLLPPAGQAQRRAEIDSIIDTVRTLLHTVRQATDDGDWDRMKSYFSSGLASSVEGQVIGAHSPRAVSFWQPRTRLPYGDFTIEMVANDIAAVGVNFSVGESIGTWGALLIYDSGSWRFHCYRETFGQWENPPPIRTGWVREFEPV